MIERLPNKLFADSNKVILQCLDMGEERAKILIRNILLLSEDKCDEILKDNLKGFEHRHKNYRQKILSNYNKVEKYVDDSVTLSNNNKLLIGAYFSKEYSIESAALFNPSIVLHPDQSNLEDNELRFVLSLRSTGEGHISSIEFREGVITSDSDIVLREFSSYSDLPEYISTNDEDDGSYDCVFDNDSLLNERVIFPFSSYETMGMEDVRFVKLEEKYYGTYTAYNGRIFKSQLIETYDFKKFNIRIMQGSAVKDKGLALFPRKINGKYFMIGRQDGVNLHLMFSSNLYNWEESEIIKSPSLSWELVQLGNCGSPIETKEGWLLITHSVGPLRKYVISAVLLDLDNPSVIIGELNEPLIEPSEEEREGYVPNVVYSCGSIIHNKELIIPYAMSDSACGFAKINIDTLVKKLKEKILN